MSPESAATQAAASAARDPVEQQFAAAVRALRTGPVGGEPGDGASERPPEPTVIGSATPLSRLTPARCLELFDAQLASRHLDLAARMLRSSGSGFYTIGSSGHEGNAGVAAALRITDPALLHYRSGAFYLVRAAQADPPRDGVADVLLGLVAAAAEPIAGGRHKVFGHKELNVIPQTSTIASHLPRAVGLAFALGRAAKLSQSQDSQDQYSQSQHSQSQHSRGQHRRGEPATPAVPWPDDAIVVCSFGDASANHSTAAGALNTAAYCAYQGLPMPLLLVCEDNGLGISVRTPPGWITAAHSGQGAIPYFHADGCDVAAVHDTALAAASWVRERREPAFLHLPMVRLGGHAGSDVESAYRSAADIAADESRDPLIGTARLLVAAGVLSPADVLDRYENSRARVLSLAAEITGARRLTTAAEVMAPIAPRRPHAVAAGLAVRARTASAWSRHRAVDRGPLAPARPATGPGTGPSTGGCPRPTGRSPSPRPSTGR